MKKSSKIILSLMVLMILLFIVIGSFSLYPILKIKEYSYLIVLFLGYLSSIFLLGYAKDKNSDEKNMLLLMTIFTLLYQVVIFVLFGLKLGFLSSSYKLGLTHLFKIVLPVVLLLSLSELLRYQWVEKGRTSKIIPVMIILFFTAMDFFIAINMYSLGTYKGWFEMISFVLFPSIMKNVLLTYVSYHYGYKPNLAYRLIMELPIYYLPIIPDINTYLESVLKIIFPFLLLSYIIFYTENNEIHSHSKKQKEEKNSTFHSVLNIVYVLILIVYIGLMSGIFKYYLLVVGSNSMLPKIECGDMVLVEKIKKTNTLKKGDILVYKHQNKVILHRIVDVEYEKNKFTFHTKGDNNKQVDPWDIKEEDVIGKVNLKIPKLGYPTVWLNRMFEGGH